MLILGLIFWVLINIWISILVYFATVPTFGDALFARGIGSKIIGVLLWLLVIQSWHMMFSNIQITVG